jgi:hypothetical protein
MLHCSTGIITGGAQQCLSVVLSQGEGVQLVQRNSGSSACV